MSHMLVHQEMGNEETWCFPDIPCACSHTQAKRKKEEDWLLGLCLLFAYLSLVMYLIAHPWKNNHIGLYFGSWDGEIKKELTVPLKGLSILSCLLCHFLQISLSWCFSAHQYIECINLLNVHPRITLLYTQSSQISCSFLSLSRSSF